MSQVQSLPRDSTGYLSTSCHGFWILVELFPDLFCRFYPNVSRSVLHVVSLCFFPAFFKCPYYPPLITRPSVVYLSLFLSLFVRSSVFSLLFSVLVPTVCLTCICCFCSFVFFWIFALCKNFVFCSWIVAFSCPCFHCLFGISSVSKTRILFLQLVALILAFESLLTISRHLRNSPLSFLKTMRWFC